MKPSPSTVRRVVLGGCSLALAAGLVACGSSDSSSTSTTESSASPASASGPQTAEPVKDAAVDVTDNPDLGPILTDADGRTLYLFEADTSDTSTCNDDCAAAWPPYETKGSPKAGKGAEDSLLGTSQREDGATQVTYNGHPLYYYAGDNSPGDTTGNNLDQFGAEWYAVTPTGETPEDSASADSASTTEDSSTTSDSSGGY